MTDEKPSSLPPRQPLGEGYQPSVIERGYQPTGARPNGTSGVTGGHQPTTSQGGSGGPPNQGSGGKK